MNESDVSYFLLPHTVIPASVGRHLSLFLPRINVLEILNRVTGCDCLRDRLVPWSANLDDQVRQQASLQLVEYRRLAEVQGDEGLMATFIRQFGTNAMDESRFRIQARLKGKNSEEPVDAYLLRLEAAVFLELARDLDEKELDLNNSLSRVGQLETEFREILGLGLEEDSDEILESNNPPLSPYWGHFSYQLRKRIGYWWRLFTGHLPTEKMPVFVMMFSDVFSELIDPVQTERERKGNIWQPDQIEITNLPALDGLGHDEFTQLGDHLNESGLLQNYYESLERLSKRPDDSAAREDFGRVAEALEDMAEAFCNERGWPLGDPVKMLLTPLSDVTLAELWNRSDRRGFECLASEWWHSTKGVFIHLE